MKYEQIQPYIEKGLVSMQRHPEHHEYAIFNYTQECQFSRAWDEVTLQCRGLILDLANDKVVARPFQKFFNYEEHILTKELPAEEPLVFEKYDGSLGILYWLHGKPWIATRGSFTSDQAVWATKWFRENMDTGFINPSWTYLFEIIYPENRIVVKYDYSGLVFLASFVTETGEWREHTSSPRLLSGNDMRRASKMPHAALEDLRSMTVANFEGFVIYYPSSGLRLKIKLAEYVRLHKLVTGLSKLAIWEHLSEGKMLKELIADVPDEFFKWVNKVAHEMKDAYGEIAMQSMRVTRETDKFETRKEKALYIQEHSATPGVCFAMLDEKDWQQAIWRLVRPKGAQPFKNDIDA